MTRTRLLLSCVVAGWVLGATWACSSWFDSDLNRFIPPDAGKPPDAPVGADGATADTGGGDGATGGDTGPGSAAITITSPGDNATLGSSTTDVPVAAARLVPSTVMVIV